MNDQVSAATGFPATSVTPAVSTTWYAVPAASASVGFTTTDLVVAFQLTAAGTRLPSGACR